MYFFFWSHRQCEGKTLRKTLFTYCQKCFNNKKLAAIRFQHHERRHCRQVFIVEALLTICKQCFTSKWRTSQWRWSKKKKKSPYDCKKWAAIPLHPRVAALHCLGPLQPQHPKKLRKKRSQLLHSPAYWPSLWFAHRTLIIDHSTSLTHHALKKIIQFTLQTTSIYRWYHQPRRKSQFFDFATFWPCLNNGLQ